MDSVAKPVCEVDSVESFETFEDSSAGREHVLLRVRLVWSKRGLLLRAGTAGLLASALLAFMIPKRYEAATQLMPPDSPSGTGMAVLGALANSPGIDMGSLVSGLMGIKGSGALFIGILQSRTVQDRLVERFRLKKVYGVSLEEAARQKLSANTAITEDRKSGIISVTVTDRDPNRAAAIAAGYVNELDTLVAQLTTSSARRERVFLEERLSAVKQDLGSAEKDFSQFASKNATIDITEQGKAMVEATAAIEGQLIAAQSQLEGLKQVYTDNNVRVREVQAHITELRKQLGQLNGRAGSSMPGEKEGASSAQYPTLRQLPILGVPYADKFRQLKVEEAVFETLTKEYELAKVQEAKEIPAVRVLDEPEVPEKKSFPPRLLIMFSGTMCSLIAGALWVLGKARWREVDSHDPAKLFAQDVFGTLKLRPSSSSPNGSKSDMFEGELAGERGEEKGDLVARAKRQGSL